MPCVAVLVQCEPYRVSDLSMVCYARAPSPCSLCKTAACGSLHHRMFATQAGSAPAKHVGFYFASLHLPRGGGAGAAKHSIRAFALPVEQGKAPFELTTSPQCVCHTGVGVLAPCPC